MPSIRTTPVADFLATLAARTPTPGGGAAACIAGALAIAQGEMVLQWSIGRKGSESAEPALRAAADALARARAMLLELADEDASAYAEYRRASAIPRDDPRREDRLRECALLCAQIPLNALTTIANAARTIASIARDTNPHLHSDLAITAELLLAGARSCARTVRANTAQMDPEDRDRAHTSCDALISQTAEHARTILREAGAP